MAQKLNMLSGDGMHAVLCAQPAESPVRLHRSEMNKSTISCMLLFLAVALARAAEDGDIISGLPGITFKYNYKMYSGYLKGNDDFTFKMFYWLIESQTNPANDPLLIWFSGGPGCSSVASSLEELGPFYVNRDTKTLYQHVYSYNRHANVLFIESPVGAGFSYNTRDPKNYTTGDDLTADINIHAISDFFSRAQPRFADYTFFVSGESYAGIYVPTVSRLIVRAINNNAFPNPHFQGMLIGNGYLNVQKLTNSLVLFNNYHGRIGAEEWDTIKATCCGGGEPDKCDFFSAMKWDNHPPMLRRQIQHLNRLKSERFAAANKTCWNLIEQYLSPPGAQDPFNIYQDCYRGDSIDYMASRNHVAPANHNTARDLNYDSTDNQNSFPCFDDVVLRAYVNIPEVLKAFHVDQAWIDAGNKWSDCNYDLNAAYTVTYSDTAPVFADIINEVNITDFRILVFNGDVDSVCNFIGDAWHMRDVAQQNGLTADGHGPWFFRKQVAGFGQRYRNSKLTIDVLTVKGAGHFVPNDRPGPALKMITNFLRGNANYSLADHFDELPHILEDTQTTSGSRQRSFSWALLAFAVLAAFHRP